MDVSVVCPFYNESQIIENAILSMLRQLASLSGEWELIVVNDGSTDESQEIAQRLAGTHTRLRVLGYARNRGRGYALRTGIAEAAGDIIVTTEIDLSWGETIVHDLVAAMAEFADADIVVASPHLQGGAYKNVPWKRVWLSRLGNLVIRACMSHAATMNTGMTRAYRREAINALPLSEDRKEFHLEVLLKAHALGMRVREIPAVLEWKDYKHQGKRVKRKSSSRMTPLIFSHTAFSLFANPVRYVWAMSGLSLLLGFLFLVTGVVLFIARIVSVYMALMSVSLVILGILLFVMGVVLQQGNIIQRELWLLHLAVGKRPGSPLGARSAPVEATLNAEPAPDTSVPVSRHVVS